MGNTLVFVDLDNIYRGMLEEYGIEPTDKNKHGVDLFDKIINNEINKGNSIEEIFAYADFKYIGDTRYKTYLEERNIQTIDVSSTNKNLLRKNASDIQLSIEVVDCVYGYEDVKKYVIISADSDMIPVMNYLKLKHRKKVSLYVLEKKTNVKIMSAIPNDGFYKIEDELNLIEPDEISIENIEKYLPKMIKYIFDCEEYNIESKSSRKYLTTQYFMWNAMRYHKIENSRFCGKNLNKVLNYAKENSIINIVYNESHKTDEIILNRKNEIVLKIINKKLD